MGRTAQTASCNCKNFEVLRDLSSVLHPSREATTHTDRLRGTLGPLEALISLSSRYSLGGSPALPAMSGATRHRLARSTLSSCCVSRILIICFSSMPQSRQHATNGPFFFSIWERMVLEPHIDSPHANSMFPRVSRPTSSLDGSQSPVFALQRGEEHNGWLSVHPRSGSGQASRA